jgi:hypothetical protein
MAVFFGAIVLWFGYQAQLSGCDLNRSDGSNCYGIVTEKHGMNVCHGHSGVARTVEYTVNHGHTPR